MNTETPSTTLRPRNRRLISLDGDGLSATDSFSANKPQFVTPFTSSSPSSRAISPVPSKHLSRPTELSRDRSRPRSSSRKPVEPNARSSQTLSSAFTSGLWETSWSSLQGVASNLLSRDTFGISRSQSPRRKRRPLEAAQSRKNTDAAQWGPAGNGERQLGHGSQEDRLARLQAKKRENLLAANGLLVPDASGRYKRRDSEDRQASSAPPDEQGDRDALVYLHHVKPDDTLAGVIIKYHCEPNTFRKANRFWPNDSIQVRTTVFLPVDACSVKGRKVPEPDSTSNHLDDGQTEDFMRTPTNTRHPWSCSPESSEAKETPFSSIPTSPSISVSGPDEKPWKHDSWVMIDGFIEAVEIARLSRRSLGFFPPTRRKSTSFSDLDTPSASLDLPRKRSTDESNHRKESRSSSSSHFAHQLQGPGGVGTLGKGVHNPGPAQDGLNKLFAPHLPNVAPRASLDSMTSTSSTAGIENVGGAIEGWVRKLATKAAARVQSPAPRERAAIGDLIELTDSVEIGGPIAGTGGAKPATRTSEQEQERLLREHFPPRGRVFGESTRRHGG